MVPALVEHNETVRVVDRQLAEYDLVHQSKDGRVCADPERQRKHSDGRKQRTAPQDADRVAKISQQAIHGCQYSPGVRTLHPRLRFRSIDDFPTRASVFRGAILATMIPQPSRDGKLNLGLVNRRRRMRPPENCKLVPF
jgi:hypothetical protein